MDTCVRGFSFMAETKTELQYIEGGELERTWRSTRRERMKKREQTIWDSFVKEKDAVKSVCSDDPYQFLEPLPESFMKEMLEDEQPKVTREVAEEEVRAKNQKEQAQHSTGDISSGDDVQHTCVVTFAEDMEKEEQEMFYIFGDDQSGGEDEALNESNGPDTVREMPLESPTNSAAEQPPEKEIELQKSSSKSSENVASVIENSIYCARVKELRAKLNEELLDLMTSLDRRDILLSSEPEDIARMVKRSAEFCNRFNRIYMYQLQRQIHDIKRNNTQSLPFAKHTQFQLQMRRIVTLHENLLQSCMVFHKSFSQTCCVRESAGALGSLLGAVRDSTHMCRGVTGPKDFAGSLDLYNDDLLPTCDKVDEFVNEYAIRCEEFLNRFETENASSSKKTKKETKTKKKSWNNRNSIKSGTESQLSMYSMDTVRPAKSSISHKEGQLGSSSKKRLGGGTNTVYLKKEPAEKKTGSTPRRYRPLMRDPNEGRPRAPKRIRDNDIRTMVESVATCASSHVSCEDRSPRGARAHKRSPVRAPRPPAPLALPPRPPHVPHARRVPRPPPAPVVPPVQLSLRVPYTHDPAQKKLSPRLPRSNELSPTKPRTLPPSPVSPIPLQELTTTNHTIPLEESLSCTRNEPDPEEQEVIPVLSVKCAMKQDLKEEEAKQESSSKESPHDERERPNEKKRVVYEYGECSTTVQKYVSRCSRSLARSRIDSPTKILNREMARENSQENCSPDRSEVTRLLKQLCSGDGSGCRTERVTGSRNVQLVHINKMSPRQPSTPQLLRILEETIKKKVPKPLFHKPVPTRSPDRYRLHFNLDEKTSDTLFQYRTKFVQHMLTSAMYANSAVGKPWEMIGNVAEQIIDEVLESCLSKMELREMIEELFKLETC